MKTYDALNSLISHLQEHPILGGCTYPTVYDDISQTDAIALATQVQDYTIICTPGELSNSNPTDGTRRWTLPINVTIISTTSTQQSAIIDVLEQTITHLHTWCQTDYPSTTPQLQSVADLDLTSIPQLQNLRGKTITLTIPITL